MLKESPSSVLDDRLYVRLYKMGKTKRSTKKLYISNMNYKKKKKKRNIKKKNVMIKPNRI